MSSGCWTRVLIRLCGTIAPSEGSLSPTVSVSPTISPTGPTDDVFFIADNTGRDGEPYTTHVFNHIQTSNPALNQNNVK